jgi:hypothetical protein
MRLRLIIWGHAFEGIAFIISVVTLFTIFADFGQQMGVLASPLDFAQKSHLGFISAGLGFLNVLSNTFFGFRFVHQ